VWLLNHGQCSSLFNQWQGWACRLLDAVDPIGFNNKREAVVVEEEGRRGKKRKTITAAARGMKITVTKEEERGEGIEKEKRTEKIRAESGCFWRF